MQLCNFTVGVCSAACKCKYCQRTAFMYGNTEVCVQALYDLGPRDDDHDV